MMKHVILVLALLACTPTRPVQPYIHLDVRDATLPVYLIGARAWGRLGFNTGFTSSGKPECPSDWRKTRDEGVLRGCQVSIGLYRDRDLRLTTGTNALAHRLDRLIVIDSAVTDYYQLLVAVAHELGHILLNTGAHTRGGVMGGSDWVLGKVDRELACLLMPRTCGY